jgi:hypothetical protein
MKNMYKTFGIILFVLSCIGNLYADDFTVTVPSTKDYANMIKPLKAGGSIQFQISVKNNRTDTCTISINKDAIGIVQPWITIDNNSLSVFPAQTVSFLVTMNVPANATEGDYALFLYFTGSSKHAKNLTFQGTTQNISIDNTPPIPPTFSTSKTSTTITVITWSGWDARSTFYTNVNPTSGFNGIKNYTIVAKKASDNSVVSSISRNFNETTPCVFTSLSPNTNYKVSVNSTDVAGNTNSKEDQILTPPAKPTGLTFSNTTYINTTLSWTASAGATGYDVYIANGAINTKLNTLPITTNSILINNLTTNTAYSYNVIALSNDGSSDRSSNAPITTLSIPIITGGPAICTGGTNVSLSSLVTGYTTLWTKSSYLTTLSTTATSAVFSANISTVKGWIVAKISAPTGQSFMLDTLKVWLGKPYINPVNPLAYYGGGVYNSVCNAQTFETNMILLGAPSLAWTRIAANPGNLSWYQTGNNINFYFYTVGQTAAYNVSACNSCGCTSYDFGFKSIDCTGGGGGCNVVYTLTPNPASTSLTIVPNIPAPCSGTTTLSKSATASLSQSGFIAVFDQQGTLKKKIDYIPNTQMEINVSALKNGIYLIQIYDGITTDEKTIIVNH